MDFFLNDKTCFYFLFILFYFFMNGKKGNSGISVHLLKLEFQLRNEVVGSCCCTCEMV